MIDPMHAYVTGALLAHLVDHGIQVNAVVDEQGFTEFLDITLPVQITEDAGLSVRVTIVPIKEMP